MSLTNSSFGQGHRKKQKANWGKIKRRRNIFLEKVVLEPREKHLEK